jgi:branched-chain amino acid transport system substrate-binding protein
METFGKKTAGMFSIFILLLFLVGINPTYSAETYKIGGLYDLKGHLSWLGEYYKRAGELTVEMINEKGGIRGKKLELIIYDTESKPEESVRAANRLIEKDNVIGLTGTATVPNTAAVAQIADKVKIPAVISSGYEINPAVDKYIFNTANKNEYAMGKAFEWFKDHGIKKVGLLMVMGPLGEAGIKTCKGIAPKYGITLVGEERFDTQATDVTPQLANLRAKGPEAIYSFTTGKPAALIARNMEQMGFKVPLGVSHGNATPGFLGMVKGISVKILVPTGKIMIIDQLPDSDPIKPVLVEFNNRHIKKYGEPANYFSGLIRDAVVLLAEGIKVAGDDRVKVRDAIENVKSLKGISGIFHMSAEDHYGLKITDMVVIEPKGSKWEIAK